MNVIKGIVALFVATFMVFSAHAQTSINLYPINSTIGIKFMSDRKVSLEPRLDFQFDFANGETNVYVNTELFTTFNFLREERFNFYSGFGLGANIYNQAQTNFCGSVPFGAAYYFNEKKRIAIIGECGIKVAAMDYIKIKSYALIGLQISLKKKTTTEQ